MATTDKRRKSATSAAQPTTAGLVTSDIQLFRQGLRKRPGASNLYLTLLGIRSSFNTLQLLRQVENGFPFDAVEHLRRNIALSLNELAEWVQIKPRTLHRRKVEGRLQPDESDRLLRASRVFGKALELFEGNAETARNWLLTPQPALGGSAPLALAKTELGAREVENLMGRLEHGVFS